ncbi:MAG TPA: YkgJ family cysteine cluster protein [Flavipsychrobacter sp.]|nr:YkgJ family cysteine cluster protein [Flavipsychrobacter sp.]
MVELVTDLELLASLAGEREEENDHFLRSLSRHNDDQLDQLAHEINNKVSTAVDCTTCGNCCKTLVINVAQHEVKGLSDYLQQPEQDVKEKYIEESMAGNFFINSVPCHFLTDNKCTIYEGRFTECREFPHLHKPGFRKRFLGTLLHYGRCPIIYNVVEEMKLRLGFKDA